MVRGGFPIVPPAGVNRIILIIKKKPDFFNLKYLSYSSFVFRSENINLRVKTKGQLSTG